MIASGVQTWILIILWGQGLLVPGYGSRGECEAAQKAARNLVTYCIPGPVEASNARG